jgi:long-chain acyl-CoA synthetase
MNVVKAPATGRQQAKADTRRRLLAAVLALANESPRVRIAEVTRRADVSNGTFYFHFPSLEAAVEGVHADILAELADALPTPGGDIRAAMNSYVARAWDRAADLSALQRLPHLSFAEPAAKLVAWLAATLSGAIGRGPAARAVATTLALGIEASTLRTLTVIGSQEPQARMQLVTGITTMIEALTTGTAPVSPDSPEVAGELITNGRTVKNSDLMRRAGLAATMLRNLGFESGDALCLLAKNGNAAVELTLAAQQLGLTLVPLNTYWRTLEVERAIRICKAKGIAFHQELRGALDGIDQPLLLTLTLIPLGTSDTEAAYEREIGAVEPYRGTPEPGSATLLLTSGSTDNPKAVLRYEDAAERSRHARLLATVFGLRADDVVLIAGPLHHAGQRAFLAATSAVGASAVIMQDFHADAFFAAAERHNVTVTFLVPTVLYRLVRAWAGAESKRKLQTLRSIIHAGAPCPIELKLRAIDLFGPILTEYYGTTEYGGTIIRPDEWASHQGSVGRRWDSDISVSIVDDSGQKLPGGMVGNVALRDPKRKPIVYLDEVGEHMPDMTVDGSFLTGDLGWLDQDDYLFLEGRRTSVIKSGGVSIYPAEIEAMIMNDDSVEDCVVTGVPDPEWGQSAAAFVVAGPGKAIDLDALRATIRARLAHYKCPREWVLVPAIPRDDAGKILRREVDSLVSRYLGDPDR